MPYEYKTASKRLLDTLDSVYFDEADLELPEEPGVYLVTTSANIIVYIGQSVNLKRRWAQGHHRALECMRYGAQYIYYLITENHLAKEAEYIYEYNPAINRRSGPAT